MAKREPEMMRAEHPSRHIRVVGVCVWEVEEAEGVDKIRTRWTHEINNVICKSCDMVMMVSHTKVRQGETEKRQPVPAAQPPSTLEKRRRQRSSPLAQITLLKAKNDPER